jgi:hypothetical protein
VQLRSSTRTQLEDLAARRFPLLPRTKPVCRSLDERVGRVRAQAYAASRLGDDSLLKAAEASNFAALILSDCAMPVQATNSCWAQFEAFAAGGPYPAGTAKLALQPLINIGRLSTRAGDGTAAYAIHQGMFEAARHGSRIAIGGRPVDLGGLIRPGADQRAIIEWLWTVLLSDGLRALCRAGRWVEALEQANRHGGVGDRLLDGRQIAIIAAISTGEHAVAAQLIDSTIITAAWERVILNCLWVLSLAAAGRHWHTAADAMLGEFQKLEVEPEFTGFLVRLGLTVSELVPDGKAGPVAARVIKMIAADGIDAYMAAELLESKVLPLPTPMLDAAAAKVAAAGLGVPLPVPHQDALAEAERLSIQAIRANLV